MIMKKITFALFGIVLILNGCSVPNTVDDENTNETEKDVIEETDQEKDESAEIISLGNGYYSDEETIYYYDSKGRYVGLQDIDPASFEVLVEGRVVKDDDTVLVFANVDNTVRYHEIPVDAESFEILKYYDDETQNFEYGIYAETSAAPYYLSYDVPVKGLAIDETSMWDPEPLEWHYLKNMETVYYKGEQIEADVDSFEVLEGGYAKDKDNIYWNGEKAELIDPESFEYIGYFNKPIDGLTGISRDNNNLYIGADLGTEDADLQNVDLDVATLEMIREAFFKDKNHVYRFGQGLRILENVDPVTFEIFGEPYADYLKDKNHVYLDNRDDNQLSFFEDADPATFEYLGPNLAKDTNHVFRGDEILEGVDPGTVQIRYFPETSGTYILEDKNGLYCNDEEIEDADPDTFKLYMVSERDWYAKDKNHVFSPCEKIEGMDPTTVNMINYDYMKDKDHVYFRNEILEGADPATFTYFDDNLEKICLGGEDYLVDEFPFAQYEQCKKERTSDMMREYHLRYMKDKNHVYFVGEIVEGADPGTFIPED